MSELYNDVASRYGMWDVCLATLKVCGHDDEPLAVKLWTSSHQKVGPQQCKRPRAPEGIDERALLGRAGLHGRAGALLGGRLR